MEKMRFWENGQWIESVASIDEIEGMMDHEAAYRVLLGVCYKMQVYPQITEICSEIMDAEKQCIRCSPLDAAFAFDKADIHLPMPEDVFLFVQKAFLDGYTYIDPRRCAFQLGRLYSEERYRHVDDPKAFLWFQRSSGAGLGASDAMLGRCYLLGRGTSPDHEKAYQLLTKCALAGHESAEVLLLLGDMYRSGLYVANDKVQALDLYRKIVREDRFRDQIAFDQALLRVADHYMDIICDKESVHLALAYYQKAECDFYDYLLSHPEEAQAGIDYAKKRQAQTRRKLKKIIRERQNEIGNTSASWSGVLSPPEENLTGSRAQADAF